MEQTYLTVSLLCSVSLQKIFLNSETGVAYTAQRAVVGSCGNAGAVDIIVRDLKGLGVDERSNFL